tara:strand:+ start:4454 stop:4771 length:318 start_codon:yes stop_codon:yes gene_type:complete
MTYIPLRKQWRPAPYDPDKPDKSTPAQKAAQGRNFGIFQLRGLYALCFRLREPYRSGAMAMIDADLIARGALPQAEHERRLMKEWRKRFEKESGEPAFNEDEIPF